MIVRKLISSRITKYDLSFKNENNLQDLETDILSLSVSSAYFHLGKIEYKGLHSDRPDLLKD